MIDRWPHPAALDDAELLKSCSLTRGRSGGPGGQHRNKVETLVTITHLPTSLSAHAGERRSQSENKSVALFRLRLLLATEHRVPPPRLRGMDLFSPEPAASALWRSRLRGRTIPCNPEHHDFPALLAEALDVLHDLALDPARAAERLAVSTSQLIKLVKDHPPALAALNLARSAKGQHALR